MVPARVLPAALACLLTMLPPAAAQPATGLAVRVVAQGLSQPLALTQDPSNPRVQYVVERRGRIRVLLDGALQPADFLDLTGEVGAASGEQGLLGLAMPADYGTRGHAFVNFTNRDGDTVIARFTRSAADRLRADPATRLDLQWTDGLRIVRQPFANHNGGTLRFGPDGFLYIGLGDGGGGDDPQHNAQSPSTLLGKMVRIDVHVPPGDAGGLRIPDDNPFAGGAAPIAARPEIWAFGLRNPWKFSVDDPRLGGTGALLVADVGQAAREEVNHEPAGRGGRNYGWRLREGTVAGGAGPSPPAAYVPLTDPVHDYPRSVGQSITGGYVYRGTALPPSYVGRYFFADFVARRLFSLHLDVDPVTGEATARDVRDHTAEVGGPSALGNVSAIEVDAFGELFVVDFGGRVLRLEAAVPDQDADGLPDAWERRFGLDATSATGDDGPGGDPDGDGRLSAAEFSRGTHPRGFVRHHLAEGATSDALFDVSVNLLNPGDARATAVVTFQRSDGTEVPQAHVVAPGRRLSIDPKGWPGLRSAEFSTLVEADAPLVVSRDMRWDTARGYGAHAEHAVEAPGTEWVLAEGATHSGFQLFYLLQNPGPEPVVLDVRYLRPAPLPPVVKRYEVAATSRRTLWVNYEDAALAATDVSAVLSSVNGRPFVVERAMYRDGGGQAYGAGHAGAGLPAPAVEWTLAEGATGPWFDLFVLVANPSPAAAEVEYRYLRDDGTRVTKTATVPAASRRTVWVDHEDARLAATAVSTVVRSTNGVPIVVERAMWWPGAPASWYEAHASAAASRTAARWAVAEGAVDAAAPGDTYVLVANTGTQDAEVTFRIAFEDRPPVEHRALVMAGSRFTLDVRRAVPVAIGRRFGVVVEAPPGTPLVVEAATYADSGGTRWAAGASLLATPLP